MTTAQPPQPSASPFVTAVVAGGASAVAVTGLVLLAGLIAPEDRSFVIAGCVAAVTGVAVATTFHRRLFAESRFREPQMLSVQVQSLLAMSLMAKLVVLAVGACGLWLAGAKFSSISVFAVAFAAAALVCQMVAAGVLSRSFRGRVDAHRSET